MPKASLLVVEDSPTQAVQIKAFLQHHDFDVAMATNGRTALETLRRHRPDVVVTDLEMPEVNGLELVEAVNHEFKKLPVVLITARGNEEIAAAALRKGAASYVPKWAMEADLIPTLERILAVLRADRGSSRLAGCVCNALTLFELESDHSLVPYLIARLQEDLVQMGLCDENEFMPVATALDEALTNAMVHGNLEVSSELRGVADGSHYADLIRSRRQEPPYCDRRVRVRVEADREQATFVVKDEGPGFDPQLVPDPADPANLEKVSGRGLLLIAAFMDEVSHNEKGNEITMIKRRRTGLS